MNARRTGRSRRSRARRLGAAAAVSGALVLTAACGGDSGGGDGDVTLRMSWWGNDERRQLTEEALDLFEEKNPGITVEREYSDFSAYYDRLTTQMASQEAPDVLALEIRRLGELSANGVLADLGDAVDTTHLDEAVLASGEVDGVQYAIPTGANAFSVMANTAVLEEAGVELPDDSTWTWDDYLDVAAEVSEATDGGKYGTQPSFNDAVMEIFAAQHGESMYGDGEVGLSEETVAAWYELQVEGIERGSTPDAGRSGEIGDSVEMALVATNDGAFGMWWSNQLATITAGSGSEIELLRMPQIPGAEEGGMFLQPGMFWANAAASSHPEESALLIDFLVNDPEAAAILGSDRGLPINSEVLEEVRADLPEADIASLAFIDDLRNELGDSPSAPPSGAGEIPDMLERYGQEVLFDRMDADEAAALFIEEANATLS